MDPNVWGPSMWRFLHCTALAYPEQGTPDSAEAFKQFVHSLGDVLPCPTCSANYARHLDELPVEPFLEGGGGRAQVFEWTVRLHNLVNQDIGRPVMSAREAMRQTVALATNRERGSMRDANTANRDAVRRVLATGGNDPIVLGAIGMVVVVLAALSARWWWARQRGPT
jgi:hypothetical protein